jgi:hypothetical protein
MTFLNNLIESEQSLKNFEAEYRKYIRVVKSEAEQEVKQIVKQIVQQPAKFEFGILAKQSSKRSK